VHFALSNCDPSNRKPEFVNHLDKQFQALISQCYHGSFGRPHEAVDALYEVFDANFSGCITHEEFKAGLMDLGVLHHNFECHGIKFDLPVSSCYVFGPTHPLRKALVQLTKHPRFDTIVLLIIVANSAILAMKDYSDPALYRASVSVSDLSWRNWFGEITDVPFTVAFALEALAKAIALGVWVGDNAYLKDAWNVLDFTVMAVGLLSIIPGVPNVRTLRTIRVLRPLRTLSRMPGMRVLVGALLNSMADLANVMLLISFVFVVAGILGVQLWAGQMNWECKETAHPSADGVWAAAEPPHICAPDSRTAGGYKCPPTQFCGSDFEPPRVNGTATWVDMERRPLPNFNFGYTSFDNLGIASLLIFQCLTMEGWTPVMYALSDATSGWTALYFALLLMVGAWFLMNLVFAVIWNKFNASHMKGSDNFDNAYVSPPARRLLAHEAVEQCSLSKLSVQQAACVSFWCPTWCDAARAAPRGLAGSGTWVC
jgi:hypothetical protein